MTDLRSLADKIKKATRGIHISTLSESTIANSTINLETPALDLNRVISGNLFRGIPDKSLTMIVGPEHSFKSSFQMLCSATAQKKYEYTPIIIDTEGGITLEFAKRWGVDTDNVLYAYCPIISKVEIMLMELIDSGEQNFIISLDSLGGLFREKVFDDMSATATGLREAPKQDQGSLQKDIKRMLKTFLYLLKSTNSIGIMSGHFFGNPNSYGGADEIGGGKFAKLAPDIIISLKKQNMLNDNKNIIGTRIRAIPLKNRFYPPFQESIIEIDYKKGIDKYAGMLDLAIESGIFKKGGAWFTHVESEQKFQGETKALDFIREHPEMLEKINDWVSKTGYSTINNNVMEEYKEDMEEEE